MSKSPARSRGTRRAHFVLLAAIGLIAAACGGSDDDSGDGGSEPVATDAAESPDAGSDDASESTDDDTSESSDDDSGGADTDSGGDSSDADADAGDAGDGDEGDTDAGDSGGSDAPPAEAGGPRDFASFAPPTGETMVVGLVNTEGPAGLNFPEIRTIAAASVEYLNEHGGMGGRPLQLETCVADASPESSQACAQELAGKDAEIVFLGLDLFPDYPTYEAAGIPLVGILPLFPADYAAEAMYMNGGNATLGAAIAATAEQLFEAETVAIVSADNPGSNGSEAAAIAAFEAAGIEYRSIKGSDNETDAGFQGLVREAVSDDPDVLVSLYGDAGCIGMMRGRIAIGTDVPVLASNTCGAGEVISAAGDDALGWFFAAGGEQPPTPEGDVVREAASIELGVDPSEVSISDLGLGGLSPIMFFTMAAAANDLAATGAEITGQSVYDHAKANESGELAQFPDGGPLECGAAANYQSVCSFTIFIGEYVGDGQVQIVEGFEELSVLEYLP
ncbi:MAG: ABC transporter substrate-binding protein [Actinomycetota bacterium]